MKLSDILYIRGTQVQRTRGAHLNHLKVNINIKHYLDSVCMIRNAVYYLSKSCMSLSYLK